MTCGGVLRVFLLNNLRNHDGISIDSIDDAPRMLAIHVSEFVATPSDLRHRPRVRHGKAIASLQSSEQTTQLDAGIAGKRRALNLAMQPDQRFVGMRDHEWQRMSDPTCLQAGTTTPELPPMECRNHADVKTVVLR